MAVIFRTDFGPENGDIGGDFETLVPTYQATRCHSLEGHNTRSGRMDCIDSELTLK
jgi:hypothetical protein